MSTLEDKILGIKKEYYCSSSESEGEDDSDGMDDNENKGAKKEECEPPPPEPGKWDGSSKNTGPKGVIRDWELYKKHENEKLVDQELQKVALAKKLTLSSSQNQNQEDEELMDLMSDDFLLEFQKKRMEEMLSRSSRPTFGDLIFLKSGNELLEAVDNEDKSVTVIIHIYEDSNPGCKTMNKCLTTLCKQYPTVKFCKIHGSSAGMSHRFKVDGVPALLVYKEGAVIGNFIRVTDDLGDEFYDSDVENFLIEHGIISDRFCVPTIVQKEDDDNEGGSDWSLE